jgi:protein-tyrosine phosphatase
MSIEDKVRVLFVCMGNICRSPTAHGVFRHLIDSRNLSDWIEIDSAGTHAYHIGEPPDQRAQSTASQRGVQLDDLRARRVAERDFDSFDYILAMDEDNYANLMSLCPEHARDKVYLFLSFAPHLKRREVPDPYYGGLKGFENVFAMIEDASNGLLQDIEKRFRPRLPLAND